MKKKVKEYIKDSYSLHNFKLELITNINTTFRHMQPCDKNMIEIWRLSNAN